ncbi:MAG: glycoside hydrolase family 3 C-terminal domain-containing protein [Deltaproteobacteria bacterium]|nr:glycoside hydrolase family 3 C-terminal domain-containing protein [Deltaproteobacteria bacterium]
MSLFAGATARAEQPPAAQPPYRNAKLPASARVADLLARMTPAEKVAQLEAVNWDRTRIYDDKTRVFSPARARKVMPHGIGAVTRPGANHDAREATELANAIQKFLVEQTRLGIPALLHEEALHGLVGPGATSFPQAIALAATFDPALVEEIFAVAARQTRARGVAHVLAPVVDVARDPRWGRIEETFGEDPFLVCRMAVAAVNGFQGRRAFADAPIDRVHVMATLKHMTGHGWAEGGRNTAPAIASPRMLREIFLPPFEAAIREAHAMSVMASYNEIDGMPSHQNRWLLSDVLRGEWGFGGVLVSDYFGVAELQRRHFVVPDLPAAGRVALEAGVDIELPEPEAYPSLLADLAAGRIEQATVDQAVSRVLRAKFLLGLFENPYAASPTPEAERPSDRALALRAAEAAIVLVKNHGGLLPLEKSHYRSVAVIGPTAAACHLGGYSGRPDRTVSILEGIRAKLGGKVRVEHAQGCGLTTGGRGWTDDLVTLSDPADDARLVAEAGKLARAVDLNVLVLGQNEQLSREAWSDNHRGDRMGLELVGAQTDLARAVLASGKPTVVVLIHGSPLVIPELAQRAPAILDGFYLGEETGTAVANVLFGDASPAGRLPWTVPRHDGAVPAYYNHKPSAERFYLFEEPGPLWPFGHGLSYTTFRYAHPKLSPTRIAPGGRATVSVDVTNTGKRAGDEVVQLYIRDEVASITRPVKELRGFARVGLGPGETKRVSFAIGPADLALYDRDMKKVVEPSKFDLLIGASSTDIRQRAVLEVVNK